MATNWLPRKPSPIFIKVQKLSSTWRPKGDNNRMSPKIIIKKRKIFFATTWRPHISSPTIKIKIKLNCIFWRPRSPRHFFKNKFKKNAFGDELATYLFLAIPSPFRFPIWRIICSSPFRRPWRPTRALAIFPSLFR